MPTFALKSYYPYLPYAIVALLASLVFLSPAPWQALLEYNRAAISEGQLWRLLTGHFLHSNAYHLLMNVVGLVLIMLIHAKLPKRLAFGWQLLSLSVATGLGLYLFAPNTLIYVGLSGALHGVLCYGAVIDIRQGFQSGYLILLGVLVKVVGEQLSGPDVQLATQIAAEVAIDSHLIGALAGCVLGVLLFSRTPRQ